jgi:GTP-binding protein
MAERASDQAVRARVRRLRVAIDGPAGSGKSSVARTVAERLGAVHLDTGAIYRAITFATLEAGVDPTDSDGVVGVATSVVITQQDGRTSVDGTDVEEDIRGDRVSAAVSTVAAHAAVRDVLLAHQRAMSADGAVVEGRDIGTVVLPDADLKVFLTASAEERAKRRAEQLGREDVAELQAAIEERDAQDSAREVAPLRAAEDAWILDTTELPFDDVVAIVEQRALALARQRLDEEAARPRLLPRVAIVGRPNVGKSTLVNRILRERVTIVEAEPGVTRDRTEHVADWNGHEFLLVDTGGWEQSAEGPIGREVVRQTETAIATADVVVQVVDGKVTALEDDERVARALRRSGAATMLVVNKVDHDIEVPSAAEHVRLGMGEPHAVSARNGRGVDDLLDAVVRLLPERPREDGALVAAPGTPRIAIVGRPNVGKSSLFNRLIGEDRAIVHDAPHTTRDAIDTLVTLDGRELVFVDTAGLRRRYRSGEDLEQYAVDRTRSAIARADVVLFLIDAGSPIGAQEQRLAAMLRESGCGLVIVLNKWDTVDEERREDLERELDRLLNFASWAPRVNVSALTGRAVTRLAPAIETVLTNHRRRVPTSELNQVIARAVYEHAPPRSGTRPVRLRYAVQVDVAPPRILLFSSGPLDDSYLRYLERVLRERYDLTGVPLAIETRGRRKDAPRSSAPARGGDGSEPGERGGKRGGERGGERGRGQAEGRGAKRGGPQEGRRGGSQGGKRGGAQGGRGRGGGQSGRRGRA